MEGLVHGACHTYVGEEAIATGVFAHLRKEDVVFSTHRGHGHALAKGLHPQELIAALLSLSRTNEPVRLALLSLAGREQQIEDELRTLGEP